MWKLLIVLSILFLVGCQPSVNQIEIPLNELSGEMQKFTNEGSTYFAVLGSDGEPRVAFDACDVCGGKKGYTQQGDYVVCTNCGNRFLIDDLGSKNEPGGCWPSFLGFEKKGGVLVINSDDLEKGAYRFE